MNLSDNEILPYPNSVFYLTGASVITLIYVTHAKYINSIPAAIGEKVALVSTSLNQFGSSISKSATDFYNKISPAPATAPATAPAPAPAPVPPSNNPPTQSNVVSGQQPGIMGNISNALSSLNPFNTATAPINGQMRGGSKKKYKKSAKKTRRSKK